MKVFIGGAWPYANGSLHIGHISSLLPGDVIARYHRLKGNDVCYVSGSDCHGTPITIRAKQENKTPTQICEKYHSEFTRAFNYLLFSYDYFGKTIAHAHKEFVKEFHKKLYNSKYIYEKEEVQAYCHTCQRFLPDRLVEGDCPKCGKFTRGEQCENCEHIIESTDLIEPHCRLCSNSAELVQTKNLYIAISELEEEITALLNNRGIWKQNAVAFTKKYIDEGLRNRAITRDIDWGIDVPKQGYENKKIYIWAENVLGYPSCVLQSCGETIKDFNSFWKNPDAIHYYVHGKDNIPFHTIILPALLLAHGDGYKLPDHIISSEYLTLEGSKISTSRSWAIWIKDLIGKYDPNAIRYYLLSRGPEKRDSDFSWKEFLYCNNSELLGAYGNFVIRTLVFIHNSFSGTVPKGITNPKIRTKILKLYDVTGDNIFKGELKNALKSVFLLVNEANKYFDDEKPWLTIKDSIEKCANTLYNCVYIIVNLAALLEPFLPASSHKVMNWLGLKSSWKEQPAVSGYIIPQIEVLFKRLDKNIVDKELKKLNRSKL